jgi:hypothetical protein
MDIIDKLKTLIHRILDEEESDVRNNHLCEDSFLRKLSSPTFPGICVNYCK